ncbi:RND family efflux transporter MFP subunit [Xanthomonas campestris]|nr:RND family efflux transporter MFP subunit [Xanthomonas sp. CFBP 8151]
MTANQAAPLATVQQLDPIYVDITQPSTAILALKEGLASGRIQRAGDDAAEVALTLEDGRPYAHAGALKFSEVSVDQGTGAVTLRAVFPNPDGLLMPGMFVRAQLQEGVRNQALLVPQRGITRNNVGQATALVVGSDNKVELRHVETERTLGNRWLIGAGLEPGERIVVDGVQLARPGAEVTPVAATAAATAAAEAAPAAAAN